MALETALGIDAKFWLNLQTNYDIELASSERPGTVGLNRNWGTKG
jgi:plasmid maintenance system antidote protein VapI